MNKPMLSHASYKIHAYSCGAIPIIYVIAYEAANICCKMRLLLRSNRASCFRDSVVARRDEDLTICDSSYLSQISENFVFILI